ncbi:MAG: BatA domain-containing protein, partial [Candidatus Eisenbacteria sp.]|nr:BatA domain-containing protein [Candidatus Eisenbacteria bacterium]
MNFTFLNGAFLFAALAALLPLLIHLISRRRVATVDFSSLRFLKELERKRIRRVRLRQILLLIVRSLIILAAALALARPTLKGPLAGGGSAHARTSVAIVVDDSASMTRAADGGDLLADALAAASEIAGLLDDGDQ